MKRKSPKFNRMITLKKDTRISSELKVSITYFIIYYTARKSEVSLLCEL